ncbi:MAG: hypothetical protein AB7O04_12640 [Hyphomonadaceae bacterium]
MRALSAAEGGAVLSANDEYMAALGPSDISIRLRRPEGGNVEALRAFYAAAAEEWNPAERARLEAMITRRRAQIEALARWLPPEIGLIKASADVEGGLPHTRGAAISFGPSLPANDDDLDRLFFHELFHVLSRHNAARHDEMYALIGFLPCAEVSLPPRASQRITNPDAPIDRHVAPLQEEAGHFLLPRLLARHARFTPDAPQFPAYFDLQFFVMTRSEAGACAYVPDASGARTVGGAAAMQSLFAAAGANTDYVFHPEETLADNFAQLMMGDAPRDAWVHERLAAWLGIAQR